MNVGRLDSSSFRVTNIGLHNVAKGQTIDGNIKDAAASMKLSKLGMDKASDMKDTLYNWEMDGELEPVDSMLFGHYRRNNTEKTGYAKEFDDISKDYAKNLLSNKYDEAMKKDVLSAMTDKYNMLLADIEKNYSGEEKEEKIKSLNEDFKTVLEDNIKKPIDMMIKNEEIVNTITKQLNRARKKAAKARGLDEKMYDDIAKELNENDKKVKSMQEQSGKLSDLFGKIDKGVIGTDIKDIVKNINETLKGLFVARTQEN